MYNNKTLDFEYGFNLGKRLKSKFLLLKPIIYNLNPSPPLLLNLKNQITYLKEYYPQREQRLKGASSALGIPLLNLQLISFYLNNLLFSRCTSSLSVPPATLEEEVYLTWNMDIFGLTRIIRYLPMFHLVEIPSNFKYVAFGVPLLGGIGLMNEKGLSYVATGVGLKDGGGEGLLDWEINNLIMERCAEVEEVVQTYNETPRYSQKGLTAAIFINLNCIWGDRKGKGVAIEHSAKYIKFKYPEQGILAIANHHQFLDRHLSGSVDPKEMPEIAGSYCRVGRMWNLLRENKGKIDLEILKKIVADHKLEIEHLKDYHYEEPVDDATICVHYWNLLNYLKKGKIKKAISAFLMGETIISLIMNPRKFILWVCKGNPCKRPFLQLDLKEPFLNNSLTNLNFSFKLNTTLNKLTTNRRGLRNLINLVFRKFQIILVGILERLIKI